MSCAVLHVPNFSLQAVIRTRTDLGGKPLALLDDRAPKAVVVQADARARAAGVTPGLTATQAVARCADLVLLPRSGAAEKDAGAALLAAAGSISPRVERTAVGICTVDLAGKAAAARLPHGRAAVEQLRRLGLEATAGIGRTPLLALMAARAAQLQIDGGAQACPFDRPSPSYGPAGKIAPLQIAKTGPVLQTAAGDATPSSRAPLGNATRASHLQEAGQARPVIEVQDERDFLLPLPLALADPPPDLAAILNGWGIRTLGALIALPKPEVGRRLGRRGINLWERAAGGIDRPIEPCPPAATFAAAMELEHEVETLQPLLFILRRFADRLALQLANASLVAAELTLELHLADATAHRRGFRLPEPTASPDILFRALQTHLETLRTEAPVKEVRLAIAPARPLVRQHGLFDTGLRDPHGFAETLARVEAVVGRDRVGTPELEPTHRPDAFSLGKPADVIGPPPPPPVLPPCGLPLRRFRPPVEAEVSIGLHGPAFVQSRIAGGDVARRRGPWRCSGGWWGPGCWAGEEWDVELARGGLFRLSLRAEQWWVEGMYD